MSEKNEQSNSTVQANRTSLADARSSQGTYHAQAEAAGAAGFEKSPNVHSGGYEQPEQLNKDASWRTRALIILLLDIVFVTASFFLALLLRFDFAYSHIPEPYLDGFQSLIPATIVITTGLLWVFRLYHSIWSFASVHELMRLALVWIINPFILLFYARVTGISMPLSYWLVGCLFGFLTTGGIRFAYRFARILKQMVSSKTATKTMIVGAGESGRALIREIRMNPQLDLKIVCAIDDNRGKHGRYIEGVPIVGGRNDIQAACDRYGVGQIIFAIPSCSSADRRAILEICQSTGCELQAIPGIYQLVDGKVTVSSLRKVRLEDLLGRDPIVVDAEEVRSFIEGRVVLVTGGGGSIGSELCRQVAKDNPKQLIIFDIYENNAYAIQQELKRAYPELDLVTLIGSVRNEARVRSVFETYRPELVFHAAAHKHVPLMEDSPCEAIKNNVFGTLKCAQAALDYGTKRFVLISTDKAVNPTNVMGASKRLCEMVVQMMDRRADALGKDTDYVAVRFGNVLGSNGSVVPLFEKQIAEGGPVTVTDPRITRFFMTIPEAVSLVLQSACYAQGGEIFVLDMGEPVKIDDMARNLIRLAGYEPDVDIKIVYTGLRPGEKLYEERLMDEEGLKKTENKLISIAEPIEMDDEQFVKQLEDLDKASRGEAREIRQLVSAMVPTYHPGLAGVQSQIKGHI